MAGPIRIAILANAAQAKRELNSVSSSTSSLGSKFKKFGVVAAAGVGIAGAAALKFGVDSVKAASDAQQSLGATETVFGKASKSIIKNSKEAAQAVGLSANQYRENANLIGSLFSNKGLKGNELAKQTDLVIKKGADLSATFGGSASDAVAALSSAFKGEFDPLERYGISMKQSTVSTEAAAIAQKQYGKDLKSLSAAQQNAIQRQATMKLINEQSAKSQGAFGRETNTLAHQQQVLAAQFENVKAKVGTALLPVLTSLLKVVNNNLVPAFEAVGRFLGPVIERFKAFFAGLGEGNGKVSQLATFFTTQVVPAVQGIVTAFQGLIAVVLPIIQQVVTAIVGQWSKIQPYVQQVFTAVKQIIVGVLGIIKQVVTIATAAIQAVWKRFGGTILRFVTNTFNNIAQFIGGAMKAIAGVVKLVLALLKGDWSGAWNAIKQILSGVWQAIKAIVKQGANIIKTVLSAAWGVIKAGVSAAWNGIKAVITNQINLVLGIVRGLKNKIIGAFSGAAGWLLSAGRNIIQGLLDGIGEMFNKVKSKLGELTNFIPDWKGPKSKDKKLLTPTGRWIMEGLVKGLDDGTSGVEKALDKITSVVQKRITKRYDGKKEAKVRKAALALAKRIMASEVRALERNAKLRDRIAERLNNAEKKLADARKARADYAQGVRDQFVAFGNITQIQVGYDGSAGIIRALTNRVEAAKKYAEVLKTLNKMGLNKTTLQQLIDAGVEGGSATAAALLAGGNAAISQVNSLTQEMATAGQSLGNVMGNEFYGAGIKAAQGLVQGLRAKAKDLAKEATALARALVRAVKQALGIKSPSRVFAGIGDNVVKGLQIGLDDTYVKRAGTVLASSLQKGFGTPALDAYASQSGAPTPGKSYQITVQAPVGSSSADIGRALVKHIDEYERQGGKRRPS